MYNYVLNELVNNLKALESGEFEGDFYELQTEAQRAHQLYCRTLRYMENDKQLFEHIEHALYRENPFRFHVDIGPGYSEAKDMMSGEEFGPEKYFDRFLEIEKFWLTHYGLNEQSRKLILSNIIKLKYDIIFGLNHPDVISPWYLRQQVSQVRRHFCEELPLMYFGKNRDLIKKRSKFLTDKMKYQLTGAATVMANGAALYLVNDPNYAGVLSTAAGGTMMAVLPVGEG